MDTPLTLRDLMQPAVLIAICVLAGQIIGLSLIFVWEEVRWSFYDWAGQLDLQRIRRIVMARFYWGLCATLEVLLHPRIPRVSVRHYFSSDKGMEQQVPREKSK